MFNSTTEKILSLKKQSSGRRFHNISKTILSLAKEREKEDKELAKMVKKIKNEQSIRVNLDEI